MRAQVTVQTSPPGSLCSPPLPGSSDPGTKSPGEQTVRLWLVQFHSGLCCCSLAPHSVLLPLSPAPPACMNQSPQISYSFNFILSGREQTPSGHLHV